MLIAAATPLTRHELARLLRAFACLIEAAEERDETELKLPKRGARRRRHTPDTPPPVISELARARATKSLRRGGVLP